MPAAHINQWKHNRNFLSRIEPQFPDWAVTVIFYVALHAVDALLKHDKLSATSHDARNRTLMMTKRYAKIWQHYQPLYGLARTIRYFAKPADWVRWDRIEPDVVGRYLKPIEDSVRNLTRNALPQIPVVIMSATKQPSAANVPPPQAS